MENFATPDIGIQVGVEPNRIEILTRIAGLGFPASWAHCQRASAFLVWADAHQAFRVERLSHEGGVAKMEEALVHPGRVGRVVEKPPHGRDRAEPAERHPGATSRTEATRPVEGDEGLSVRQEPGNPVGTGSDRLPSAGNLAGRTAPIWDREKRAGGEACDPDRAIRAPGVSA